MRAAARAHLSARLLRRPLRKIHQLVLPAVLLLREGQACVLLEIDPDSEKAVIWEPESEGKEQVALADLERDYRGYTLFVKPEVRADQRADQWYRLPARHWFWGTLLRNWRIYRDVLAASFLINVFALVTPLFVMNVYDRVVPNNAEETLWVLAIGVLIVFLFDFLLRGLRGYFVDLAGKKAEVVLSANILEKVLGLKMGNRPESVGAFVNYIKEFDSVREFITSTTILTLIDLPFVVLFVTVIAIIGGPLALIPSIGIPVVLIYGALLQWPMRKAVEQSLHMGTQRNATLVEALTGLETIKALGSEGLFQRKWEEASGYIAQSAIRARALSSSALNLSIFLQHLGTIATVVGGVYLVADGRLSLGGLIACVILMGRAMAPMAQVATISTRYNQAKTALRSLDHVIALPQERSDEHMFVHHPVMEGAVEFDKVSFNYPESPTVALENISFKIRRGEKVAVIGSIGSGKSTLHKLISGLYEPTEGAVLMDGVDMRQLDPADIRRNIAYVAQDAVLFFGTIRDNLLLGNPFADDDQMLRAAEIAGVTEFVNRHPHGFDLQVGERGEGLSGGQRQAVSLARALLLEPPLLLLDEPTNSMDNSTETRFKHHLLRIIGNKTLILMTHRASLLDLVDRVMVLDQGRLVADGDKASVLAALREGKLRGVGH